MMMTPTESTQAREAWLATLRSREAAAAQALGKRRERALAVAREAARILRDCFGAQRVLLFGSLAHGLWFHEASDIDLAATGLDADAHLAAIARLEEIEPGLRVDLLRLERCPERLRSVIEDEGVEL